MLSRAEQIDVLRYWEEIELLTPPTIGSWRTSVF